MHELFSIIWFGISPFIQQFPLDCALVVNRSKLIILSFNSCWSLVTIEKLIYIPRPKKITIKTPLHTNGILYREKKGVNGLFIALDPKARHIYNNGFLFVWLNNFENFYWILIGWFSKIDCLYVLTTNCNLQWRGYLIFIGHWLILLNPSCILNPWYKSWLYLGKRMYCRLIITPLLNQIMFKKLFLCISNATFNG